MKRRAKALLRVNILSLFLIAVSFISVTLAWFAYNGIANVDFDVNVQTWFVQLEHNDQIEHHNITITLDELYPGMEPRHETIKVHNLGDADAAVNYDIISARILGDAADTYLIAGGLTSDYVEDLLAHKYPFKINMSLTKPFALGKGDESIFEVSISWPLDSYQDALDSAWGTKAYDFALAAEGKPAIQVVISLGASQSLEIASSPDMNYNLGKSVLYNVEENKGCSTLGGACINTYVLDINNKLGDTTVTLLPNPFSDYGESDYLGVGDAIAAATSTWTVGPVRALNASDVLKIISGDVYESLLIREGVSDAIIGTIKNETRITSELKKITEHNGYYQFNNGRFGFLSSFECHWLATDFKEDQGFVLKKIDNDISKVYGLLRTETCKVLPVIEVLKTNINNQT